MTIYKQTLNMKWLKGFLSRLPVVSKLPFALEFLYLANTRTHTLAVSSWATKMISPKEDGISQGAIQSYCGSCLKSREWLLYYPPMSLIRIEGGCISFFSFLNVSFSRDILPGLAMAAQKGLQALCKTGAVLQCMYVLFFFSFGHWFYFLDYSPWNITL